MVRQTYQVNLENGLHARPAAELVKLLKPFKSQVNLIKDEKRINLKSILQIMTTSIKEGEEVTIEVDGEDEKQVVVDLKHFFS